MFCGGRGRRGALGKKKGKGPYAWKRKDDDFVINILGEEKMNTIEDKSIVTLAFFQIFLFGTYIKKINTFTF
jgi:hypothetical protein